MKSNVRAAAVQAEPVWFDAAATVEKTIALIEEAAGNGAEIVAFPEVWIPGYPVFLMYATIDGEMPFVAEYRENSIAVDGPEMTAIQKAAAENNITVGLGFSERSARSLYMSQTVISNTGERILQRRKLKPTHRERALYGQGDGSDLQVVDTDLGKVSALMCWENLQPFNKMAMLSKGAQIHIASWPQLDFFGGATMSNDSITAVNRTYALECGSYTLMSTQTLSQEGRNAFNRRGLEIPEFVGGGGACIFGPDASRLTQPLPPAEEGIVYADLDMRFIELANYLTDPAGHYSRPDVYRFSIDTTKRAAFNLREEPAEYENVAPDVAETAEAGESAHANVL